MGAYPRGRILALLALFALLTSLGWAGRQAYLLVTPLDRAAGVVRVRVSAGCSFEEIRCQLVEAHLIAAGAPLAAWARVSGADRRIQAGTYDLSAASSPIRLLARLAAGEKVLVRVTLPEGLTRDRIFGILADSLRIPIDSLRAADGDTAWLRAQGVPAAGLEGYLFPETYLWDAGIGAREALGHLVRACLANFDASREARLRALGLSRHEALTLASIVEAETSDPQERHRVAAVYHNRLRLGWLLQADPTVAYALGRPGEALTRADLEAPSPYNTYQHPGLPPGPICCPGLASLEAALWPSEGCEDLYFVARGDGGHAFSRSLEEHNRWVRRWQAVRSAGRAGVRGAG